MIGGPEAQEIDRRLRAKYLVPDAREAIERAWSPSDDVALELNPLRWRSWTATVLHRVAIEQLGSAAAYEGAWLSDE